MKKVELVAKISQDNDLSKTDAEKALNSLDGVLKKEERIGKVTREYTEIIRPTGVIQRFYNMDVEQPWITKVR